MAAVWLMEERVLETSLGRCPPLGIEVQNRQEKISRCFGIFPTELILLMQDVLQPPVLQLVDVLQLTFSVEEVFGIPPACRELLGILA